MLPKLVLSLAAMADDAARLHAEADASLSSFAATSFLDGCSGSADIAAFEGQVAIGVYIAMYSNTCTHIHSHTLLSSCPVTRAAMATYVAMA